MRRRFRPVEERAAEGEVERVYHELKQVLRVRGVSPSVGALATHERFLVAMWDAIRADAETRAFEDGADQLRAMAARAAIELGPLDVATEAELGESQRYQLRGALELYHYLDPKLLLLAAAVHRALRGEPVGQGAPERVERLERGVPDAMAALELAPERGAERPVRAVFRDVRRAFSLDSVPGEFRSVALWPEYLRLAWRRAKPLTRKDEFGRAAEALRERARRLSAELPFTVPLSRATVEAVDEDVEWILRSLAELERALPPLILTVALFLLDFSGAERLPASPFPASPRAEPAWAH